MAVSTHFQDEIDAVDNTKTLTFVVDATYDEFQWSYSGLEVRGGTELACEYGASELLEAMGFRWYSPFEDWGYVRPASIPTNLTASKQSYWMPNNSEFLVYGHQWGGSHLSSRALLNDRQEKFAILNGFETAVWPAGHRWINIITNNQAWFDARPQMLVDSDSFDLPNLSASDYDDLVDLCAAFILSEGLNEWNRTNMDPSDGDLNPSDDVFPFTKAVADKVRAGTTETINGIPPQTGVASAQLGLYAYAGHRLPPTSSVKPGVYTQVALGFNQTDLSYTELVEQHGAKADAVLVREYWDTQAWSNGQPLINGRTKTTYFDRYLDYYTAGAIGVHAEFTANWLVNLVMHRYGVRKCRTGMTTYADALNDVMTNLFDDDAKVRELYELWSNPSQGYHKWNLAQTFDIVDAMATGWYKTYFQYLCVILYEQMYMPDQLDPSDPDHNTPADPFPAAFSKHKAHITAVRELDIIHSYAFIRQEANTAVNNYPDLKFNASPEPDWFANPYLPTQSDFDTYHTAIAADTDRDDALDSTDLVLVQGLASEYQPVTGDDATSIYCEGIANYVFIGPGSVTFTHETDEDDFTTEEYGDGLNFIYVVGNYKAENSGGELFLDMFPSVRKDPGFDGQHFLYIPTRVEDEVDIESLARITVWDDSGRLDITPAVDPADVQALGPGQVWVHDVNTRGTHSVLNANRYLSMSEDRALMPRAIAEEDFSALVKVVYSG